uniref:Uncharacterized protein n=1 Tax=Amphora coffeiformis TaxID=265554 RepID=A0A7S3L2B3_9STRA|mmetsp:Transcript_2105/g.4577  ORF Transcript_2105/g.4577 Transcript_2105/m.4577 type:complete len:217 (-) Transcript_2105:171-821(-)|eukprot:scaffold4740_cov165-Amphora_coffeaeformis.AAC.9
MQNAITCNARAIFKMETHDYEGAFNLLRSSMLSLTSTLERNAKLPSQQTGQSIVLVSSCCHPGYNNFYAGSFLFSVPVNNEAYECLSNRQVDYCSAACLFNMALACHLEFESTESSHKRDKLAHQARILYLTAYQLLQKYPIEPTDSILLLLMALCANLMEIEMELGSVDELRFWRRILENASFAADPVCFAGSSVYTFFDSIYIAPGELVAAKAA